MRGFKAIGLLSIVFFSAAILNAQNNSGAMLYAHGDVKVNGQAPGQSASIVAGDRLETADSSVATINRTGSSVVVNPNSSIQYTQSTIEVMQGTARVSTLAGMSAQAGNVTVSPKDGKAKFDIVQSAAGTMITPREGSLIVHNGTSAMTLEPGATKMFASGAPANQVVASGRAATTLSNDPIQSYETVVQSGLPICANVKLCFGRGGSASQIQPCRCR
jgi:hypothetical protein